MAHGWSHKRSRSRSCGGSHGPPEQADQRRRKRNSSKDTGRSPSASGSQGPRNSLASNGEERSRDKARKRKRHRSSSSSSSSSSGASSGGRKKRGKHKDKKSTKKKKKKKMKKKKKKDKDKDRAVKAKVVEEMPGPSLDQWRKEPLVESGPVLTDEQKSRIQAMKPMTKEEWDARQSIIRKVVDPETGRTRLIKGDGEVLEEIVTKERHKEINKQATRGDGLTFQLRAGLLQ
ncbi:ADP-ribosylation factor-like protein 6-interacting protein 4 [Dromiciops gliroides]|uniref:ADP-ribosylation factor-like protein 6-interacting protein 4 n=1 Tax=Dromiciops gliroides TaxID=33562 RepID=UPI001CC47082|nr:ADP-ribosylation factor-like protein 6-interacting protein 4 [Dromiciops gliroides]